MESKKNGTKSQPDIVLRDEKHPQNRESIGTCVSKSATMLASRVIQSRWIFFLLPNLPAERRSGTGVRPQAATRVLLGIVPARQSS